MSKKFGQPWWEGLLQEAKRIENGFRNIEKVQLIKEEND